jgi:hypothetical protein
MRRTVLLALVVAALFAATAWPRLCDVETGRTPEYARLRPRDYSQSPERVARAAEGMLAHMSRWSYNGSASGPRGTDVAAVHTTLPGLTEDVTIRIRVEAGKTRVSVRSRSRRGPWDFGQNARNIDELLAALDRALS